MEQYEYQCCFCGETVLEDHLDPCGIDMVLGFSYPEDKQFHQGFVCHWNCFRNRLHPSIAPLLVDFLNDE